MSEEEIKKNFGKGDRGEKDGVVVEAGGEEVGEGCEGDSRGNLHE